jgi:hypothetical protein
MKMLAKLALLFALPVAAQSPSSTVSITLTCNAPPAPFTAATTNLYRSMTVCSAANAVWAKVATGGPTGGMVDTVTVPNNGAVAWRMTFTSSGIEGPLSSATQGAAGGCFEVRAAPAPVGVTGSIVTQ